MNTTTNPRSYWPIGIIAFFAVALAFLITFIVWAAHQREDLVADNYYDNEVRFQQKLDLLNRTQPLAAQVAVAYDAALQDIVITLPAAQAQNASGQIVLYRPSDERLDQHLALAVAADGTQRLAAKELARGLWKVRIQWTANGKDYFFDHALVLGKTS